MAATGVAKTSGQIFLSGLAVLAPVAITVAVVWWVGTTLEDLLGAGLRWAVGDEYYVPGSGIAAGVAIIFAIGLATRVWLARRLIDAGVAIMTRVPLVGTLFTGARDVIAFVQSTASAEDLDKVVLVELNDGMQVIGFVTEDASHLLGEALAEDRVPVYLQMSYQIGGYTVFVERARITPLDISIEEGMRWVLSAGISTSNDGDRD